MSSLNSLDVPIRERVSRRARHIRIEVHDDGSVLLVYPHYVSRAQAHAFLAQRADWIRDKRDELLARQPAERGWLTVPRWDGSDRMPLGGTEVPLTLMPMTAARSRLRIEDDAITLFASSRDREQPAQLEKVLRRGLSRHALHVAVDLLREPAERLGVSYRALRMRDHRTQWGSCGADGVISLSWRLVMAPPQVFRYVAVHELCHLLELNHSKRFWRLVAEQHPDYQADRDWLRAHGTALGRCLPRARFNTDA